MRTASARGTGRTPWFPFVVVAAALALLAAQSAAPTPLYPLYAERWGFTDFTTSGVFSVYIATLAITLVIAGSLSDMVGRRPVALVALVLVVLGLALLARADGLGDLLLGRALQGVAGGLGFGTLGAAMLDQSPVHRHPTVSVINASMPPLSQGIGAVLSGLAVEFLPHPFWLVYLVTGVLVAVVLVGVLVIPERAVTRPFAWRELAPVLSCPASARPRFAIASAALCASWAVLGLYLGVGPTIARTVFGVESPTASGLLVLMIAGAGAVVGVLTFRVDGQRVMLAGSGTLVVAAALMASAVGTAHFPLFCVASLVAGAGFGASFQGGVKLLMEVTTASERGGTLSLLYLVAYVAFGLPTLLAGLAVPLFGLGPVVQCYAALVALLAAAAFVLSRAAGSRPPLVLPT